MKYEGDSVIHRSTQELYRNRWAILKPLTLNWEFTWIPYKRPPTQTSNAHHFQHSTTTV